MADVFVASKEPPKNAFGQNGSPQASSLLPGQTKPNIAGVSPPTVNVPDDYWQTRKVDATPIKAHDGMKNRSNVKETIPSANIRRSTTDNLGRPVKR
jgi:hypothetical protein